MVAQVISISDEIREARRKRGVSMKDVSADICVSTCYLQAIENGTFDKLPAQAFAVGFVRSYARALGLDEAEIVARFKSELGTLQEETPAPATVAAPPKPSFLSSWGTTLGGLAGVALTWFGMGAFTASGPGMVAEGVPEQPVAVASIANDTHSEADAEEIAAAHIAQEAGDAASDSSTTLFPAAYAGAPEEIALDVSKEIVLEALEDSWVKLAATDGTELWSGVLREGDIFRPNVPDEVVMTTSNAGGVRLNIGGQESKPLGKRGEIITDFALTLPQ